METTYPTIQALPQGINRPLWSVMVPTYNDTTYLEQTLRSVLDQDPGVDLMQIEVVDDHSTKADIEMLVQEIGQGRITFFRQPQNVGQIQNWNTCIERARGEWVHILHQDDIVLPGFFTRLQAETTRESVIGAAFCRHNYFDENSKYLYSSLLEREEAGVLLNWLPSIAVMQRIQFASILVKRSTYEQIGGFCPQARSAADWEMWMRIAAHYVIWYEPEILACFRLHSASESSSLMRTGANLTHIRDTIEISKSYLPDIISKELTDKARRYYALAAFGVARGSIQKGFLWAACIQIWKGFKFNLSLEVVRGLLSLIKFSGKELVQYVLSTKIST